MTVRNVSLFALILTSITVTTLAVDGFENDFFKNNTQWEDLSVKREEQQKTSPTPDLPPSLPTPQASAVTEPATTQPSNLPTSQKPQESVTKQVSTPAVSTAPNKTESKPAPINLDILPENETESPTLAETPGVRLDKLITKSPTLADFNKENSAKTRKIYDYRNKLPDKYLLNKIGNESNTHLPKYTYQNEYSQMLFSAVSVSNINAIKELLQKKADINARIKENGMTPLMVAVKFKNPQVVRYLGVKGADLNARAADGQTALHIAAILGLDDIFSILISLGANPNIQDSHGKVPILYVAPVLQDRFMLALANSMKDKNKALISLAYASSVKGVKYLIDLGANIDVADESGVTPLIIAAKNNDAGMVGFLLYSGANINIKDKTGATALSYALKNKNRSIEDAIDTILIKQELDNNNSAANLQANKGLLKPEIASEGKESSMPNTMQALEKPLVPSSAAEKPEAVIYKNKKLNRDKNNSLVPTKPEKDGSTTEISTDPMLNSQSTQQALGKVKAKHQPIVSNETAPAQTYSPVENAKHTLSDLPELHSKIESSSATITEIATPSVVSEENQLIYNVEDVAIHVTTEQPIANTLQNTSNHSLEASITSTSAKSETEVFTGAQYGTEAQENGALSYEAPQAMENTTVNGLTDTAMNTSAPELTNAQSKEFRKTADLLKSLFTW